MANSDRKLVPPPAGPLCRRSAYSISLCDARRARTGVAVGQCAEVGEGVSTASTTRASAMRASAMAAMAKAPRAHMLYSLHTSSALPSASTEF